jgi:hypothetical protein
MGRVIGSKGSTSGLTQQQISTLTQFSGTITKLCKLTSTHWTQQIVSY